MNCPNCGAAMKPYPERGYLHCEHCGNFEFPEESKDGVLLLDEQSRLACPFCQTQMQIAWAGDVVVLHCPQCKGLLATQDSFPVIVRRIRAQAKGAPAPPRKLDPDELGRRLVCSNCGQAMHTHPYAGPGNVVVDVCTHCELIFLDNGELSAIRDAPGKDRGQ
jgi:Zn-finger nucleic acid-binding protein